jgi:outer membrane receptor protein involved in Fe transport
MLFLAQMLVCAVLAQVRTAQLTGSVTDASAALIVGAEIRVSNADTGVVQETETNDAGLFVLPNLEPGRYSVLVRKEGFRASERKGIVVHVGDQLRLDFSLELGSVADQITVEAEATLLQTAHASQSMVVDNRKVVDLPLNGRNAMHLVALTPGITASRGFFTSRIEALQANQSNFVVNGGASFSNDISIDGSTNTVAGHGQLAFTPSVDTIQEFKAQTTNYSAEYGRTGGGVISVVTKSGTNQPHGTLYHFHRNRVLDANNFFNNRGGVERPPYILNQYGGTVGGPIFLPGYDGRNRSFFFFGYEGIHLRRSRTFVGTVPTAAQRSGDFSETVTADGRPVIIYNPFSTRQQGTGLVRDPFPGNRIPAGMLDPVARNLSTYFPLPNQPGTRAGANNYLVNAAEPNDMNILTGRLDHNFSSRNNIFLRISRDFVEYRPANFFQNIATSGSEGIAPQPDWHATLGDTHTFSPSLVMEVRYGFARFAQNRLSESDGIDFTTLGFSPVYQAQAQVYQFPTVNIGGLTQLGPCACAKFVLGADTHSLVTRFTYIRGRHTLKFGADLREYRHNSFLGLGGGTFNATAAFTQGPNALASSVVAGSGYASFLLGTLAAGSAAIRSDISYFTRYYAGYIQDDFVVSPKLTLNIGLRYDYETPRMERYDRLSYFDPSAPNPIGPQVGLPDLRGGLRFTGVDGAPRTWSDPDRNNFGPRFGFAYQFTPRTVLRGGYGITYLPGGTNHNGFGAGQDGFSATTPLVSSLDGVTPEVLLKDAFADGLIQPPGASQGLATLLGQAIRGDLRNLGVGYMQQWSMNVQRELFSNVLVEAGYVGTRGIGLPMTYQMNQLPDEALALGQALLAQVPNPFYGLIDSGTLSRPTVARGQLLRPYPHFNAVTFNTREAGSSSFHSLQLRAERRFAVGFSLQAAYSFSKLISDTDSRKGFGDTQANVQNSNNLRLERAVAPQDVSQRFVLNYVLDLPFGKSRALFANAGPVFNALAGGWSLAGITTLETGRPLAITTATNNTNSMGGGSRPNNNGQSAKLDASERSIDRWFDTSVFSQPAPFTFGNTGRTLPDVREPGLVSFNLSLLKQVPIRESLRLQLRAEAFNLFNTPQFGTPGTVFGNPQFGIINSQANSPRQVQLGLKVIF